MIRIKIVDPGKHVKMRENYYHFAYDLRKSKAWADYSGGSDA